MYNRLSKFVPVAIGLLLLTSMLYAVQSQFNLATQATGIGAVANGMTGAATAATGNIFSGPASGSAAAPSFKTIPIAVGLTPLPNNGQRFASCQTTGSTMTCLGENADSSSADVTATATLPTYTTVLSDATGAACGGTGPMVGTSNAWYAGRKASITFYARISSTSGIRSYIGFVNGGNLFCSSETNISSAVALIRFSSTTPDTNFMGQVTDAVGTNVVTCDTGVAGDTNFHIFQVFFDNANSRVAFYVDNLSTPGCTISSNFDATLSYHYYLDAYCNTCGGVNKSVDVASFHAQTTPF